MRVALLILAAQLLPGYALAASRPNVLVFLADDQGWGDFSCHGNANLQTPHLDSLARDGASCERFYVCPVCSPTRAEFLTGRYHPRSGVFGVTSGGERMDSRDTTIADVFRAAGYRTACFGKWHNGTQWPYHPNARGFEHFYGFCSGHWGHYFNPLLERNNELVTGTGYVTDDFAQQAVEFIAANRELPFFALVAFNTPHSPMQVPARWWEPFSEKRLQMEHRFADKEDAMHTRAALAMCENIDWNVGQVLDALESLQLAENTIVVYFSDNGPNGYRWNGGLRGIKGSTDEGGVRSALFMRWPERIAAGHRVGTMAAAIDLLPTLVDMTGVPFKPPRALDGLSLKSVLLSPNTHRAETVEPSRRIFSHWGGRVSVRTQDFMLDHSGHLYDLRSDHGQHHDVTDKFPHIADQLHAAVGQWREEVLGSQSRHTRPFTVGHRGADVTQLPARDGRPEGDIKRSSQHPNCSYFTNWTHAEDRISWSIDVLTPGRYSAVLHYACPAADVGSTVALEFRDARIRAQVSVAHDPPIVGAAEDRVERTESYVKDFKPLTLGVIELPQGEGQLTLAAEHLAGAQVMEVRLLTLTRVE